MFSSPDAGSIKKEQKALWVPQEDKPIAPMKMSLESHTHLSPPCLSILRGRETSGPPAESPESGSERPQFLLQLCLLLGGLGTTYQSSPAPCSAEVIIPTQGETEFNSARKRQRTREQKIHKTT